MDGGKSMRRESASLSRRSYRRGWRMADLLSAVIHHKNKRVISGNKRCPRSGPGLFF